MNRIRFCRAAAWCVWLGWSVGSVWAEPAVIVVDAASVPAPVEAALGDLRVALAGRKIEFVRRDALPPGGAAVVVGIAGTSATVDRLLAAARAAVPEPAESLCIRRVQDAGRTVLVIAGRDARGLSYALSDVARAVELAPAGGDPLADVREAAESPFLRVRSLTVHPFSADLEEGWYYDEAFWRGCFAALARDRWNNFTLTFSDQTNYLNPIYAFLAEVPGRPQVRVKGLDEAGRRRNLKMLGRIAELARDRGLDFTLGVWMQAPVPRYSGAVTVEGLPEGEKAADYCAAGMKLVLQACPAVTGVQLRMNEEAGVPEDRQTEFYRPLFRAIRDCGRPVRLDLRYKGLRPSTTRDALDAGLDVTVSTKFWCEHLGLPYHPTVADSHYRESRYSFGAMLHYPRDYRVTYRLWSVGSNRLLLWADPEYAARFAQSCRLGGGEGFEVFAPLSNKGYGNAPGHWRIFADRSYEVGRWESERHWMFPLVFGRLGYNPQADAEVWRRELRGRFGAAAGDIEEAYRAAGGVLPLITAAHLPGASEWSWWPEMDTGGLLAEYMRAQPSDTGQFYGIRTWKQTPQWRWEPWDATNAGYVEDALAGKLRGRRTPMQVAAELRRLADRTDRAVESAAAKARDAKSAEFRSTVLDMRVSAELARYHAAKTLAAVHLAFFESTNEAGRLPIALKEMRAALAAWESIVKLTDGVYHHNLIFGVTPDSPRSKLGHHHSGHWKDRLPELREDIAHLEKLLREHGAGGPYRTFPGETPAAEQPRLAHDAISTAEPGRDLPVSIRVEARATPRQVLLHWRPLNQTMDWKEIAMRPTTGGRWEAVIPGAGISARWDLQYHFEVLLDGGGWLWPRLEDGQPYFVAAVNRPRPGKAMLKPAADFPVGVAAPMSAELTIDGPPADVYRLLRAGGRPPITAQRDPATGRLWLVAALEKGEPGSTLEFEAVPAEAGADGLTIAEKPDGLLVAEGGRPVLFHQVKPKAEKGKYQRANYVHPLYGPDGEEITDDFPADHRHQRGVFWAWHQLLVGEAKGGDPWSTEDFLCVVQKAEVVAQGPVFAVLRLRADWRSLKLRDAGDRPRVLIEETTTIRVFRSVGGNRCVDFDIALQAKAAEVRIGGAENMVGYSGFTVRVKRPADITLTDAGGVIPVDGENRVSRWADCSGLFAGGKQTAGVGILTHPSLPEFPPKWVLRRYGMQNLAWPGRNAAPVPADKALLLRQRLIIHRGDAKAGAVAEQQKVFEMEK